MSDVAVQLRWCPSRTPTTDEDHRMPTVPRLGDLMDDSSGRTFRVVDIHWFPDGIDASGWLPVVILHSLDRPRAGASS